MRETIRKFLEGQRFAVAGASNDRDKYGNKVLRCYVQNGRIAYPVNPRETTVEGLACFPDLRSLPEAVDGISIVTPPAVTERIVEEAPASGARSIWMQPGSESAAAVRRAGELGFEVISGGPCLLVTLGFRDE